MTSPSLRLRLLMGGGVAIFVALALAWAGLNLLFQRHVERREADMLIRQAERLAAGVSLATAGVPSLTNPPGDPRFDQMASGLYWQVSTPGMALHSPSLWDQSLRLPVKPDVSHWEEEVVEGPFNDRVLIVERLIHFKTGPGVLIQVAQDDKEMRQAYAEFGRELAASLGVLWLVLALAGYIQVSLGLKPLSRLQAEMEHLRRSPAARLREGFPYEVKPLIGAINQLADARESDLGRARKRAADLAHSLKTPLSVLAAQSRKARAAGAGDAADGLDRAISAVGAALEAELTRARSAAARAALETVAEASVSHVVEGLISVIERTEQGERVIFDVKIDAAQRLHIAEEDLTEMLGALIENAARHARRHVRIRSEQAGDSLRINVEDDGPGLAPAHMESVVKRGLRLDETGSGHGLGLAIVRDLIEATEGDMALGRSELGGLSVTLTWTSL